MITTHKMAYRAGFASGFVANSNEILERRKFKFAEISVREDKKMRDEFHKGYFLCQDLIRKVNIEKAISGSLSIYENQNDTIVVCINQLHKLGYSGLNF